ncbi:predicted protein [Chaetoceros tenuissimus]|uniref:F-box domain-containing protein n=1 Tax=Chaetoceros tenuissimus TaxID=426638 RepID=A0AAD3CQF0_9STRA|nr:predicted protein [Chaetoceros tenuissimus]
MDEQNLPESKRQRLAVSKNEAKDTHKISSGGVLALPANVLSNCFSFLGPSGHYYFLASVCKDFKVAVDELYQGNYNTSIESIITSMSTIRHVFEVIESDVESNVVKERIYDMMKEAVYKYDRPDLLEVIGVDKYTLSMDNFFAIENTLDAIEAATVYNSTEIMRSIITHEEGVIDNCLDCMKKIPDWYDFNGILSKSSAACDAHMISQLVEKGVEFDGISIVYSLTRRDIETFKCLLDIVQIEQDVMRLPIILNALQHEMHLDAMKCLKGKKYFEKKENLLLAIWIICSKDFDLHFACLDPILKLLLEDRLDKSVDFFLQVLCCCIVHERMDILSYIHENCRCIDTGISRFLTHFAEKRNMNIPSVTNLRRTLSNLP